MYEENTRPLPAGDLGEMFGSLLDAGPPSGLAGRRKVTPAGVLVWAKREVQPALTTISRRLLLPGSGIEGIGQLAELATLADQGRSCIVCLNHRSNLDVPTLHALLEDHGQADLFHRLIWIAGRKLHEDAGPTRLLAQGFNQVIVSPHSWLDENHTEDELHEAHQINIAAHRAIHTLRNQGWAFALFPTATRLRPGHQETAQAIDETDSYLKTFDYMLLGRIDGCTLPVTRDRDMTREVPRLDRVRYTFGGVLPTADWRERRPAFRRPRSADRFGQGHHRGHSGHRAARPKGQFVALDFSGSLADRRNVAGRDLTSVLPATNLLESPPRCG